MKGAKLEVETLLVTCLSQHPSDLIKTIESSGLSVDDIVASPLTTSYAVLTKQQRNRLRYGQLSTPALLPWLCLKIYPPISLEVFPIGSSHITNDIALGLQIPLDEAVKIKINYGTENTVSKKKLSDIIEARLNDIFEMIENHLKEDKQESSSCRRAPF